ncbi:MAG: class I SAM-dependent methyltransferase [Neisseria sp.]|uniref:class I SAM-dependent methyltransferase n=1 Tax=Neisseria sp. TaxID=192066 RepID=UPI0026DB10CE|nr:class I SAM-dependent methyltransferase [Neisseria sp.]MDO4640520.1 class I SAM-dependent methyltransferase [Neisseria sp.]
MENKVSPDKISGLSSTLLIPLWAKAVEYNRPDALLRDAEAVRMMALIDYDFDEFASAKASQVGCCGRAGLIDKETRRFIEETPDCVVVQIGAGLDARFERLGRPQGVVWYDLDLPEVIDVRRKLLPEAGNHYLSCSMFDESWMDTVASHGKPVLAVFEGVLMYFDEAEVKGLLGKIAGKFPQVSVVADILPKMAIGKAKRHDALKKLSEDKRPEFKWGLKDPLEIEQWQQGWKLTAKHFLSSVCMPRYPFLLRLLYSTGWGRRNLDFPTIRLDCVRNA